MFIFDTFSNVCSVICKAENFPEFAGRLVFHYLYLFFSGAFIEIPSFSGLSYLMFPFQQLAIDRIELNFMTRQPDGLLFLISSANELTQTENFIVIYLIRSQLRLKLEQLESTMKTPFDFKELQQSELLNNQSWKQSELQKPLPNFERHSKLSNSQY